MAARVGAMNHGALTSQRTNLVFVTPEDVFWLVFMNIIKKNSGLLRPDRPWLGAKGVDRVANTPVSARSATTWSCFAPPPLRPAVTFNKTPTSIPSRAASSTDAITPSEPVATFDH
jgi:hypothetical protein